MKKIFGVSRGDYSDYSVEAIFSTREMAEEAAELIGGEVEEFPFDYIPDHPEGKRYYAVAMNIDGTVVLKYLKGIDFDDLPKHQIEWFASSDPRIVTFRLWAKDEKHAVKVVNEERAKMVATNTWPIAAFQCSDDPINYRLA